MRLYPPIWFLLFAAAIYWTRGLWPLSSELMVGSKILSIVLIVSGLLLAIWAAVTFRSFHTTSHPYAEASCLVTGGPYRHTRNPMYLSLLMCLLALSLWLQSLFALPFSFVFVLVINRYNIVPEEQYLERRFGKAFSDYCTKTRRWL
ncbi:MAG: isoprenylcysteine carboxylmethyltransferase family protein [Candidatus Thiodiazotropha sp. (ex Myrtea spinifera)]|nr:isoprenylcysteine carboxylmethyltransferase family protein [Candidatus Thiodiazotropha sp. (ex Myrtea spinifera)]MCU7827626.1 isoprenylcysteine carboxylmethyltransferase family protein [Candidatus Thiodiazotropha sp. (ex Myrtea sp. 'scaly one' KF741663)]